MEFTMPEAKTPASILADTKAFGFVFQLDNLEKNGKPLSNIPILTVVDSKQFDESFPGIVLSHLNGQSTRVGSQRIGRDYAYDHPAEPQEKRNENILRLNVEWLLGIKAARTVEVIRFAGPEGQAYDTQEEAALAWQEWASNQ
jgi:hypothetical protein